MSLSDIATAHSSFQKHLGYTRVQLFINGNIPNYSLLRHEERWASFQKSLHYTGKLNFGLVHYKRSCPGFLVSSLATLEPKCLVQNKDREQESYAMSSTAESQSKTVRIESSTEDSEEVDEREKLRRLRISEANKGKTAETLQRIRERSRLALQSPQVKMKMANPRPARSTEAKRKIAAGLGMYWQKRRKKLMLLLNWQNLIAEAARRGFEDEEELQWVSYNIPSKPLQQEWLDSIEQRKSVPRVRGCKRAPKSLEQMRKIAKAIVAKWANPIADKEKGVLQFIGRRGPRKGLITTSARRRAEGERSVHDPQAVGDRAIDKPHVGLREDDHEDTHGLPREERESSRPAIRIRHSRDVSSPDTLAASRAADDDNYDDRNVRQGREPESSSSIVMVKRAKYLEGSSSTAGAKKGKGKKDESWIISGPCPGGPTSPHVIPSFGGHFALALWTGSEPDRGVLTGYNRAVQLTILGRMPLPNDVREMIGSTGLGHLMWCMIPHIDMPLLTAFAERWQPDTNTFHLPFGEMSILLHDVERILGIRTSGEFCVASSDFMFHLCKLFGKSKGELKSGGTPIYEDGRVLVRSLVEVFQRGSSTSEEKVQAYLMTLLGKTLFVDKLANRVQGSIVHLFSDVDKVSDYSWGTAALAYLYRQLGISTRSGSRKLCGCLSLLQVWIYEYFPDFRPFDAQIVREGQPLVYAWSHLPRFHDEKMMLDVYRQRLDNLTADSVRWTPYGPRPERGCPWTLFSGCIRFLDLVEPYQPDRCMRQFGYVQVVPNDMPSNGEYYRPSSGLGYKVDYDRYVDHLWKNWIDHKVVLCKRSRLATIGSEVDPEYMGWFKKISHPLLLNPSKHQGRAQVEIVDTAEVQRTVTERLAQAYTYAPGPDRLAYLSRMTDDLESFFLARMGDSGGDGGSGGDRDDDGASDRW